MLETVVTLGIIAGVTQLANKIKQSRMAKKELRTSLAEVKERFPDADKREPVQVTLFMTSNEMENMDNLMGHVFTVDPSLEKKEAAAILFERQERKKKEAANRT